MFCRFFPFLKVPLAYGVFALNGPKPKAEEELTGCILASRSVPVSANSVGPLMLARSLSVLVLARARQVTRSWSDGKRKSTQTRTVPGTYSPVEPV